MSVLDGADGDILGYIPTTTVDKKENKENGVGNRISEAGKDLFHHRQAGSATHEYYTRF